MASLPHRPISIVTLLTNDEYLPGVTALLYSIKSTLAKAQSRFDSYPPELVVLITDRVSQSVVASLNSNHDCTRVIKVDNSLGNGGFVKLHLWKLTQYDRLLYLDADCLVVKDVSHLLYDSRYGTEPKWNGFAAAQHVLAPTQFNSGVLYIRPSLVIFNAMKSILKNTKSYVSKDTGFLNEFFKDWHTLVPSSSRLPDGYNAQICQEFRDHWRTVEKKGELYVIHFIGQPKPWNSPLNESSPWLSQWRQKFAESSQHLLLKSQRKAPPPTKKVSSKDMHAQIHRRYKELRKQNMDPRQAMLQARFDCGDTNRNVDVGAQVANMFGLGNIM